MAAARVLALVPDLMFASRLKAALEADGAQLTLLADPAGVPAALAGAGAAAADVLVVDLTDPDLDGPALLAGWREQGLLTHARTLGFYAHVDVRVRERARQAGFDMVIPRSRMAREGAQLIARLSAGGGAGGPGR
jgi:CheY-like chemotaxis protein